MLNGGLPGWSAAGGALDTATPAEMGQPSSTYPIPPLDEGVIRSKEPVNASVSERATLIYLGYAQMFENSHQPEDSAELVIDARSGGRRVPRRASGIVIDILKGLKG